METGIADQDCSRKSFHIGLSWAQWDTIKPLNLLDARRKLEGEWTHLLSEKVNEIFHGCVLCFKMNRIKSTTSRKTKAPFFHGKAYCKGPSCSAVYTFIIEHEPIPDNSIEIFCTKEGIVAHFPDEINKRQVKGKTRQKVAELASEIGPVNYYYKELVETPYEDLELGNASKCQNPGIIRKIVSELLTKERLHKDTIEELKLLKEAFQTDDIPAEGNKTDLCGYIQEIGADPFTVILVCKEQIQLVRKLSASKELDIYIDATGSVIGNIPNQQKPYMYSIVVRPDPAVPPVSVADMLTTQHTIPRLEYFLASLKRSVELGGRKMAVRKVETDFSWVMIQSALKTFNLMNIKQYLLVCMGIINKEKNQEFVAEFTVVHMCAAHLIKAFSRHLKKVPNLKPGKKVWKLAMQCFALLQNCTYLSEAITVFELICSVFGLPHENKQVKSAHKTLVKRATVYDEDEEMSSTEDSFDSLGSDVEELSTFHGKTIKDVSPFTDVFSQILQKFPRTNNESTNDFYCPDVLSILVDVFLPLLPLWSGLLLQPLRNCIWLTVANSKFLIEIELAASCQLTVANSFHIALMIDSSNWQQADS